MNSQEKNPFKLLETAKEVPEEVKTKLMKNIAVLQLVGNITDLFSDKMGKTAMELLKRDKNTNL